MARMLVISDATVHRQLKDFNLPISHSFSTVDDNTLDGIVRGIKEEFSSSGYRMVCGVLRVSTMSRWNWLLWMCSQMVPPTTKLNFLLKLSTLASRDSWMSWNRNCPPVRSPPVQGGFCTVLIDPGQLWPG